MGHSKSGAQTLTLMQTCTTNKFDSYELDQTSYHEIYQL